jgi:cell division protease FtsH
LFLPLSGPRGQLSAPFTPCSTAVVVLTLLKLAQIEARLVMYFRRLRGNKRLTLLVTVILLVLIGVAAALLLARNMGAGREAAQPPQVVHVDQLANLARDGNVRNIILTGDNVTATISDGSTVVTRKETQASILDTLRSYGVPDSQLREISLEIRDPAPAANPAGTWAVIIVSVVSIFFVLGLVFIVSRGGGAGRYGSFTKSGARLFGRPTPETPNLAPAITFAQVAGVEEAKQELAELVDFLKKPDRFSALGATIPKGVLLIGPPGTGKTLLAKAVAGEAGVPFHNISGSEFVEMFVGVGASRVRDLFTRARRVAPCIVFIDEIDAVGRHRGGGMRSGHGGHDEREQTLNQILVEMDGFDGRTGVIVIAATNRPDVLDEALLRPGRFDRQVMLDNPDIKGRKAILGIHAHGKPLGRNVDLEMVARQTPGFSGADLANLMNEAAILAARRNKHSIAQADLDEAVDRVIAGPQKKSRVISERERKITAYHEVGHALVATELPNCDPVHKVTIIGRGRTGGFTRFLPAEDRSLWARSQFLDTLAAMLGGHTAEELTFGEVTTGASNDIERATDLAQRMVCQYGMSEKFGPVALGRAEPGSQVGRGGFEQKAFSDEMAREIDQEIRLLMEEARGKARAVLTTRRDKLEEISRLLLEKETVSGEEFKELLDEPCAHAVALAVEMPAVQLVAELLPVKASREAKARTKSELVSPSARLAKRLQLRPKSVLSAVSERPGKLYRKAAEALKGKPADDADEKAGGAELDLA